MLKSGACGLDVGGYELSLQCMLCHLMSNSGS